MPVDKPTNPRESQGRSAATAASSSEADDDEGSFGEDVTVCEASEPGRLDHHANDGEDGRLVGPEVVKYRTQRLMEEHGALQETRLKSEEEAKRRTAQAAGKT